LVPENCAKRGERRALTWRPVRCGSDPLARGLGQRATAGLIGIVAGVLLTQCRTAAVDSNAAAENRAPPSPAVQLAEVPLSLHPLLGFDPSSETSGFEPGRTLLYRVRLLDDQLVRQWFVAVAVAGPTGSTPEVMRLSFAIDGASQAASSALVPVQVTLVEGGSTHERSSQASLPQSFMEQGLYAVSSMCQGLTPERIARELSAEQKRQYFVSTASLFALLQLIQGNDDLADVLWTVIKRPSVLALLSGEVMLTIAPDFERAEAGAAGLPSPLGSVQAFRVPVHLDLKGARALEAELLVCPPRAPLHMAAGLIALEGSHPDHPERRVLIELIGARGLPAGNEATAVPIESGGRGSAP